MSMHLHNLCNGGLAPAPKDHRCPYPRDRRRSAGRRTSCTSTPVCVCPALPRSPLPRSRRAAGRTRGNTRSLLFAPQASAVPCRPLLASDPPCPRSRYRGPQAYCRPKGAERGRHFRPAVRRGCPPPLRAFTIPPPLRAFTIRAPVVCLRAGPDAGHPRPGTHLWPL
jgi:hypothetical protein